MSESGLQMSMAKRLHFHFEATSVKGIYLLWRDSIAGELTGTGLLTNMWQESFSFSPCQAAQVRGAPLTLCKEEKAHLLFPRKHLAFQGSTHLSSGHQPSSLGRAGTRSPPELTHHLPKGAWGSHMSLVPAGASGRLSLPAPLHQGPEYLHFPVCAVPVTNPPAPAGYCEGLIRACRLWTPREKSAACSLALVAQRSPVEARRLKSRPN